MVRASTGWCCGYALVLALVTAGCAGTPVQPRPPAAVPTPAPSAPTLRATAAPAPSATEPRNVLVQGPPRLHLGCADALGCPAAVGMWVRPAEPEPERCTATLIAPDQVLTASHCLASGARHAGASCRGAWVAFADDDGGGSEWFACDRVVSATDVDDSHALRPEHAVVRLARHTGRAPLVLDARPVQPGAIVSVASVTPHPVHGSSHRLAARLCRVQGPEPAVEALGEHARRVGWLSHCAIERGNSGSPVLDYAGRVRAIVHGGTSGTAGAFAYGVTSALPGAAP